MTTPNWSWKAYGHRLRVTRIALGLTEQQAAEAHGIALRTYRKWEAGSPQRSAGPFHRFIGKYTINIGWLLEGEAATDTHLFSGKVAILPVDGPKL